MGRNNTKNLDAAIGKTVPLPMSRRQVMYGVASALALHTWPFPSRAASTHVQPVELVRFAWGTDVGTPTPFQISTAGPAGAVLLTLIYDTLTWKDEQGIIPWLASDWSMSDSGQVYTFSLVPEVRWQDGQPLTPEDVAFSFDTYARHPYRWVSTEVIDSTIVTSDGSVQFTLKRPYAAFIEEIAGTVPIIPRHIWDGVADPATYRGADGSIGSGPFRLAEYNQGEGAYRLLAYDGYWRGKPLIREWRQLTVPQETNMQVIQQGSADIALSFDASVGNLLADDDELRVFETAPLSMVRLVLNTGLPPLDRKEVRQAIAYALDRRRIAETITRGQPIVGSAGVVPPETPWHHPSLKRYDFDPDRARALLDGQRYTIDIIADANAREPDLLEPMLEAIGITLRVQRVDAPTRVQLLAEGAFQMALTSHIGVGGDPDYLRRWYTGEEANAFAQGPRFDDEEYARLGEQQAIATDPRQRREIVFRMQEILAEELPTIVLYHRRFYWIYDPAVFSPMATWGGLLNGVPFPNNKLALIAP